MVFAAGTLAPDLGFFPGSPASFSHRVHQERTADFVRCLVAGASSPEEHAFAKGWALHVIVDTATHPFVTAEAANMGAPRGAPGPDRSQLWHKKLEWGFDCHVLSRDEDAEIGDQVEALRHTEPEGGFLRAAANLYESDASEVALRRGWISMTLWVPRLLRILLWTGSVRWPGRTLPTQL